MKPTHCQQVLAVLSDGRWHTSAEIYRQVFCVLHSRVSALRKQGYVIEHRGGGSGPERHEYRWNREQVAA